VDFGARDPALAALVADVGLLSAVPVTRGLVSLLVAAHGLLVLGLYAVLERRRAGPSSGLAAAAACWIVPSPGAASVLAIALGLGSAALLIQRTTRSSALAAGLLLAASVEARTSLLPLAVVPLLFAGTRLRAGLAGATALAILAPWLARAQVSPPTAQDAAFALLVPALGVGLAWLLGRSLPIAAKLVLVLAAGSGMLWFATRPAPLRTDDVRAIAWLRTHSALLDEVCAPADPATAWIPALGWRRIARGDSCRYVWQRRPSDAVTIIQKP
jgi:hypothetical protein